MRGETVTVIRRVPAGTDAGNNIVYEELTEDVDNVLVGPPSASNADGSPRPDGITVDLELEFPRTYVGDSLRGADIIARGRRFIVIGDPIPVDGDMTPTDWNLSVDVHANRG